MLFKKALSAGSFSPKTSSILQIPTNFHSFPFSGAHLGHGVTFVPPPSTLRPPTWVVLATTLVGDCATTLGDVADVSCRSYLWLLWLSHLLFLDRRIPFESHPTLKWLHLRCHLSQYCPTWYSEWGFYLHCRFSDKQIILWSLCFIGLPRFLW